MKNKKLLAIILLSLSFCLVSGVGYGEVMHQAAVVKASLMDVMLLEARVSYMMRNPDVFLDVDFYYDWTGAAVWKWPGNVDTKGKVCIWVQDNLRGGFSYKTGTALLDLFKGCLEIVYAFIEIEGVVTDLDTDIVAKFVSRGGISLGYFYQGKYHLWEE